MIKEYYIVNNLSRLKREDKCNKTRNPSGNWVILFSVDNFKPYRILFHTFWSRYKCNKSYEISPNKRFLCKPEKINFKFHRNWENQENTGKIVTQIIFYFVKFEAFELCFLLGVFSGSHKNVFFGVLSYNLSQHL